MTKEPHKVPEWEELIEQLADIEHQRWSDWQKYLHNKCLRVGDGIHSGKLAIDIGDESRWERQINTPYSELSEKEKESDRREVMRYFPLIKSTLQKEKEKFISLLQSAKAIENIGGPGKIHNEKIDRIITLLEDNNKDHD